MSEPEKQLNLDKTIGHYLKPLDNPYATAVIWILLLLYATVAAPNMPRWMLKLFRHPLFQLLVMILIAFLATRKPTFAILLAVAFFLSLQALTYMEMKQFKQLRKMKHYHQAAQQIQAQQPPPETTTDGVAIYNAMDVQDGRPMTMLPGYDRDTTAAPSQ